MYKVTSLLFIIAAICFTNAITFANDTTTLVKFAYSTLSSSENGTDLDATGATLLYEKQMWENSFTSYYARVSLLDLEATAGAVNNDSANSTGIALGVKFNLRLSDIDEYAEGLENGMPYLRLGWEKVTFDTNNAFRQLTGNSISDSKSGAIFSLGYEKDIGEFGAFAEYTRHSNTWEDSSITVGGYLKF